MYAENCLSMCQSPVAKFPSYTLYFYLCSTWIVNVNFVQCVTMRDVLHELSVLSAGLVLMCPLVPVSHGTKHIF